jgi:hypothetical protein
VVLATCLIGDIFLIVGYVSKRKDVNISKRYQDYEISLNKPLLLSTNQFKADNDRKLVIMGHYDFPFALRRTNGVYDEWGLDIQFDVRGSENKRYRFSQNNYVQSGFTEQLIELDTGGASSLEIKLLRLNNVPSDKIKISVGRKYNIDAYEVEGWLEVFIVGMTILTGIVALTLLRNKRKDV